MLSLQAEKVRGWKLVQKCIPRIIEYGRSEGILVTPTDLNAYLVFLPLHCWSAYNYINKLRKISASWLSAVCIFSAYLLAFVIELKRKPVDTFNITGIVQAAQEEAQTQKEAKSTDKVNLPTNDLTLMHEAIPFLPLPVALFCMMMNVIIPGTGTILSGVSALCLGQPRVNMKEGRKLVTLIVNLLVGISQFFTITFLFVGWFWSIAWGGLLVIHAMQYREALQQRRQEAVATAAIEALTKDSILHRRDVKTLVKTHKQQTKDKKEKENAS